MIYEGVQPAGLKPSDQRTPPLIGSLPLDKLQLGRQAGQAQRIWTVLIGSLPLDRLQLGRQAPTDQAQRIRMVLIGSLPLDRLPLAGVAKISWE